MNSKKNCLEVYGRGKQFSNMMMEQFGDDGEHFHNIPSYDDNETSSTSSEDKALLYSPSRQHKNTYHNRGGKIFRPMCSGKTFLPDTPSEDEESVKEPEYSTSQNHRKDKEMMIRREGGKIFRIENYSPSTSTSSCKYENTNEVEEKKRHNYHRPGKFLRLTDAVKNNNTECSYNDTEKTSSSLPSSIMVKESENNENIDTGSDNNSCVNSSSLLKQQISRNKSMSKSSEVDAENRLSNELDEVKIKEEAKQREINFRKDERYTLDYGTVTSSSSDEREFDMDTFDEHELVKNDVDQHYLDSLPEIERESILARRFEELKAEADMKHALREKRRKERKQKTKVTMSLTKRTESLLRADQNERQIRESSRKKMVVAKGVHDEEKENRIENNRKNMDMETTNGTALVKSLSLSREFMYKMQKGVKCHKVHKVMMAESDHLEESDLDCREEDEDTDEDYEQPATVKSKKQLSFPKWQTATTGGSNNSNGVDTNLGIRPGGKSLVGRWNFIEAEITDYVNMTISRRKLATWCNEPFFKDAVLTFFVRLAVGKAESTLNPCYKFCKIVGVEEIHGKNYKFPAVGGQKPVVTNKLLCLERGESKKYFKMVMVSDSPPTDDDVNDYINILKKNQIDLLSKNDAIKMKKTQDNLVNNYTYTNEDIEKAIEAKKYIDSTIGNIGAEKTRVTIAVHASEEVLAERKKHVNELKMELLEVDSSQEIGLEKELKIAEELVVDAQIDLERKRIEERKVLDAEENRKNQMRCKYQAKKWSKVNKKAKMENERAYWEAYKLEMETQRKKQPQESFNPYARRKVKPQILWEVGQGIRECQSDINDKKNEKSSGNSGNDLLIDNREKVKKCGNEFNEKNKVSNLNVTKENKESTSDEMNVVHSTQNNDELFNMSHKNRLRRGISFQDYQKLKASIENI